MSANTIAEAATIMYDGTVEPGLKDAVATFFAERGMANEPNLRVCTIQYRKAFPDLYRRFAKWAVDYCNDHVQQAHVGFDTIATQFNGAKRILKNLNAPFFGFVTAPPRVKVPRPPAPPVAAKASLSTFAALLSSDMDDAMKLECMQALNAASGNEDVKLLLGMTCGVGAKLAMLRALVADA